MPTEIEYHYEDTELTRRCTDESIAFIRRHHDKPFFLYLAHPMTHREVVASKAFQGRSKRGNFGDAVEELDWSVMKILAELKALDRFGPGTGNTVSQGICPAVRVTHLPGQSVTHVPGSNLGNCASLARGIHYPPGSGESSPPVPGGSRQSACPCPHGDPPETCRLRGGVGANPATHSPPPPYRAL